MRDTMAEDEKASRAECTSVAVLAPKITVTIRADDAKQPLEFLRWKLVPIAPAATDAEDVPSAG
jgi:hypothetical protein